MGKVANFLWVCMNIHNVNHNYVNHSLALLGGMIALWRGCMVLSQQPPGGNWGAAVSGSIPMLYKLLSPRVLSSIFCIVINICSLKLQVTRPSGLAICRWYIRYIHTSSDLKRTLILPFIYTSTQCPFKMEVRAFAFFCLCALTSMEAVSDTWFFMHTDCVVWYSARCRQCTSLRFCYVQCYGPMWPTGHMLTLSNHIWHLPDKH